MSTGGALNRQNAVLATTVDSSYSISLTELTEEEEKRALSLDSTKSSRALRKALCFWPVNRHGHASAHSPPPLISHKRQKTFMRSVPTFFFILLFLSHSILLYATLALPCLALPCLTYLTVLTRWVLVR